MSDLDAEIARIAALRGRSASDYAPEKVAQAAAKRIAGKTLTLMFVGQGGQMALTDAMPAASRRFIRECPYDINVALWADLLTEHGEAAVILAATAEIARRQGDHDDRVRKAAGRRTVGRRHLF